MIEIDGSMMEGGGQLLRMAITYSVLMAKPVRVINVRGGRDPPGLRPQHLTTLKAVAEICRAKAKGLSIGSREIEFHPSPPRGGTYTFDIGTAGSISLLLQCVAPISAFADSRTRLKVIGGTATEMSPPVTTLERVVWEASREMGFDGELKILREGFYPKGGGIVEVQINPIDELRPIVVEAPEEVDLVRGISVCGRLPSHVAERQARSAEEALRECGYNSKVEYRALGGAEEPLSPGSYISLWAEAKPKIFLGADSLGKRGKPAERVGAEAAESLIEQLRTGAGVDLHTADNLIIWCSLANGDSVFRTSRLTLHTETAIELAKLLGGAEFKVEGQRDGTAIIRCRGVGLKA
ncbi:MAG: RNA 3'-terminal phosphate cyclase [Candidatus Bathyarchaeia archaeon]